MHEFPTTYVKVNLIFDVARSRLRDTTKEAEELQKELHDSQHESGENMRRNEEIKARAQETVRQ